MIEALIFSLVMTWILELGFAWCMHLRDKEELKLVLLVNFITNPIVVSLYWMLYRTVHPTLLTVILEVSAVLAEAFCYHRFSHQVKHPLLFSILINTFSYLTGVLIQLL